MLQGRREKSIAGIAKVVHVDPSRAEAFAQRGFLLFDQGDHVAALADLDRALSLDPHHYEALLFRAKCLVLCGPSRFHELVDACTCFLAYAEAKTSIPKEAR